MAEWSTEKDFNKMNEFDFKMKKNGFKNSRDELSASWNSLKIARQI